MRDGEGREIDFRNTVILMTANLGSDLLMQLLDEQPQASESDLHELLRPVLRGHFQPALLARFQTVIYRPLPAGGAARHCRHEARAGKSASGLPLRNHHHPQREPVRRANRGLPAAGYRRPQRRQSAESADPAGAESAAIEPYGGGAETAPVTLGYHEEEGVVMAFDEGTISDE